MRTPRKSNGPAFPVVAANGLGHIGNGMSIRQWFATFAPMPSEDQIAMYEKIDRSRNPHNDPHKPKIRTRYEIIAYLRFEYADAMVAEYEKGGAE
jgi:hypothetical protein